MCIYIPQTLGMCVYIPQALLNVYVCLYSRSLGYVCFYLSSLGYVYYILQALDTCVCIYVYIYVCVCIPQPLDMYVCIFQALDLCVLISPKPWICVFEPPKPWIRLFVTPSLEYVCLYPQALARRNKPTTVPYFLYHMFFYFLLNCDFFINIIGLSRATLLQRDVSNFRIKQFKAKQKFHFREDSYWRMKDSYKTALNAFFQLCTNTCHLYAFNFMILLLFQSTSINRLKAL